MKTQMQRETPLLSDWNTLEAQKYPLVDLFYHLGRWGVEYRMGGFGRLRIGGSERKILESRLMADWLVKCKQVQASIGKQAATSNPGFQAIGTWTQQV